MSYENPEVPHEVNVSRDSALAEFLRLALGALVVLVVLSAALYLAGGWLARFIPFSVERSWAGDGVAGLAFDPPADEQALAIERYLQQLTARLAAHMDLPAGMELTVHYADFDVPNAFATLGGHILVTSDLYRQMPSENALAMVLAHEVAHIRARDPISALGGTATVALVVALASGDAAGLAQQASQLTLLGYSRRAERRADELAIAALLAEYGHAGDGDAVFRLLAAERGEVAGQIPAFLSTHPADSERIERVRAAAANWRPGEQPLRPLAIPGE